MKTLKEFFKEYDVRIGEDFTTTPPIHYSSLHDAFQNYFATFRDKRESYHFVVLDIHRWNRQSLAFSFTGSNDHIILSILGFHRFIELLLKDILRRINPFLAVKFLEKEEEIFNYFDNKIEADEIKTIEYSETFKRFKYAFKHYDKHSNVYKENLKDYEFILSQHNTETLSHLTEWRNRIMHNGTTLPNLFAFEYLISQRLIPLINEIIKAENKYTENYKPYYFETSTGIQIIDEIIKTKFDYKDFKKVDKSKDLALALLKIGHLKELGRAAINNDLFIRKNRLFFESYYENPIGRNERFAEMEKEHEEFYNLKPCLCCGAKALVVYRKSYEPIFNNSEDFISWFKCFHCDYSLKNNVGDPYYFGLSDTLVFATE